jgi:prepilin-type N-terminal cleavage/methylation domain-containing protein
LKVKRHGLTLIELMCALLLGAMVVSLLCGVVATMSRREREMRESWPDEGWLRRVRRQMEHDFANSRSVRLDSGRLLLDGYAAVEVGESRLGPSVVWYEVVVPEEGEPRLLRRARAVGGVDPQESTTVMCFGVEQFSWQLGSAHDVDPGLLMVTMKVQGDDMGGSRLHVFPLVRQGVRQ